MTPTRARASRSPDPPRPPIDEALTRLRQGGIVLNGAELRAFHRSFPRIYSHYAGHFALAPGMGRRKLEAYAMIEALETVYISEIPRLLRLSAPAIHRRFRLFHDRILH